MSRYQLPDDYEDAEAAELRAQDRAERREQAKWRHWCDECHGRIGPGSPCYPGEDAE